MRIKKSIKVSLIHTRVWARGLFGRNHKLPGFIIAGVQKGGTSSLYYYLTQHPNIANSLKKETNYFDLYYEKGVRWYKGFFTAKTGSVMCGEATPSYFYHPDVPKRISETLTGVKVIILLRDPTERAFSHFKMEIRRGKEPVNDFFKALSLEKERLGISDSGHTRKSWERKRVFSYADRGLYSVQVNNWLEYFDRKQLLFLKSEEFFANPTGTLNTVCDFLGVSKYEPVNLKPRNVGAKTPVPKEAKKFLEDYYRQDLKELKELLGPEFQW
ncbi:MAG: sulfotransferase [Cyclobacteriaceae bacterium]